MSNNTQHSTDVLGVRISPEVKGKLEAEAKKRHLSVNEVVAEMLNGSHTPSANPGNSEHHNAEHHFDAETEAKFAALREVVKQSVKEGLAELEAEKADNGAAQEEEKKRSSWPF
ncbi:MAG: hypothetical protein ABSH52_03610 [Terriglobia bacterium]|jgi:predicted transcriptional regulator